MPRNAFSILSCKPLRIFCTLLLVGVCAANPGDSGEEFANNLLSDLAPLLALFGEDVTKQFLSQSTGWIDDIVFAMGPLGILAAVSSAIRVGGPRALKSLIGRARESVGEVEMELMSSTSVEVCELWRHEGIVRVKGRPNVAEIIY